MKTKNVWRLKDQPKTSDVLELLHAGLVTKEEAKDIIFTQQTEEDRDKKSLQSEIKFLRELVEKLSDRSKTVEIVREIQKPYYQWAWYKPYEVWCGTNTLTAGYNDGTALTYGTTTTTGGANIYTTSGGSVNVMATDVNGFSTVKTF
jgi:hypothetical protein